MRCEAMYQRLLQRRSDSVVLQTGFGPKRKPLIASWTAKASPGIPRVRLLSALLATVDLASPAVAVSKVGANIRAAKSPGSPAPVARSPK